MNFNEEATILVKEIVLGWDEGRAFHNLVGILEDYLVDLDTFYRGKMENKSAD